jgi:hypothetical protein
LTLGAVSTLDNLINRLLTIEPKSIFDTSKKDSSGARYYQAWSGFRKLALGILVIAALVVIIASAFGLEILDAYTIRKVLPRFLIAILFITLSWSIMEFLINLSNDAGNGVRALIYWPFRDMVLNFNGIAGLFTWATVGASVIAFTAIGTLTFGITALMAVLIAFLVLVLRELIVILLVLIAPIAIACLILPNTRKMWELWQNTFTAMLVVFPIISAMIATGRVFAVTVTNNSSAGTGGDILNQIVAFIAYILPYFLLPFAFKLVGGVLGTLAGITNDRSRGAFDRLKNFRGQRAAHSFGEMRTGNRFKANNIAARGFNNTTRGIANLPNAGVTPWKMRSRMQAGSYKNKATEMAEYMDKNEAFKVMSGNDDYLQATMRNMGGGETEADWRRYLAAHGYEGRSLEQGVATIRAAKRATSGEVFKAAAVVANASTGTGWKEGSAGQMMQSIAEAADGDADMTARMLAEARSRANQSGRIDLGGAGFGGQLNDTLAIANGSMTAEEATRRNNAKVLHLKGAQDISRARGQAVQHLAPAMRDEITTAYASGNEVTIKRALAKAANMYDTLNYASPENAEYFADNVLAQPTGAPKYKTETVTTTDRNGQPVTQERVVVGADGRPQVELDSRGNPVISGKTLRQEIEQYRSDPEFLNMRKEFGMREAAAGRAQPPEPPEA